MNKNKEKEKELENQLKLRRTLDDYSDRCFVYSVLLNKTHSYYNKLKTLYKLPIILTSSVLSVVNSTNFENESAIKIVNISFNLFTALVLSLGSALNLEQKHASFLNAEKKFLKLYSLIELKILDNENISTEYIKNTVSQYEQIVELIDFDIPVFIQKNVHNTYAGKKTLPLIINGVPKLESERSTHNRTRSYRRNSSCANLNNSILYFNSNNSNNSNDSNNSNNSNLFLQINTNNILNNV